MNNNVARVLKGWLRLTAAERQELAKAIREHESGRPSDRQRIEEEVRNITTRMTTGPLGGGGGCPCCS